MRAKLEGNGLAVGRLEREGRIRFVEDLGNGDGRAEALRGFVVETGRNVWVAFDWIEDVDPEAALRQQEELTRLVEAGQLVVKTATLEKVVDRWPSAMLRRTQSAHSGVVWLSETGL